MNFLSKLAASLPVAVAVALAAPLPAADWPQWRGPDRTGLSAEKGLLKDWPASGPRVAWDVDHVGVGYSSIVVKDGRIYTMGDINGVEHIIALREKDGSLLWAVMPEPVKARLDEKLAAEWKRVDANGDGMIDEIEGMSRFGNQVFDYDTADDGDATKIANARAGRMMKALDKNGDGKLDVTEAGDVLRDDFARIDTADKNADAAALATARAAGIIKQFDKDGDGVVTREESKRTALERQFSRLDRPEQGANKGDDKLTADEVQAYFLKSEKGLDGIVTAEELAAHYARRFANKDGILSKDELRGYYGGFRNDQGDGPRGTPTIDGKRLYIEGGAGDVACLDIETGKTIWHVSLTKDLGGGVPGWGYSESPLIEGDLVIVTPGGKQGTLAALDKNTGQVVWRSTDETQGAHYSSPIVANIQGVRQIIQFANRSLFAVDAKTGKSLWSYTSANNGTANCSTPIVADRFVFAASAYGTGGGLAEIGATAEGKLRANQVYFEKKMQNHHGGMVLVGKHLYGFGSGGLICMEYLTGNIAWTKNSVSKGSLVYADGMLYCLGEGHQVALVEANPAEYVEHGKFKIDRLLNRPSWAHPVVANGKFYIRNQHKLTAYDVGVPLN